MRQKKNGKITQERRNVRIAINHRTDDFSTLANYMSLDGYYNGMLPLINLCLLYISFAYY